MSWILKLLPWLGRIAPWFASYGKLIAVGTVLVAAFYGGYKVADWRWQATELAKSEALREDYEEKSRLSARIGTELEEKREKTRVVYRTVREVRTQYIDRPVYSAVCIDDDGLRNLNAALAGAAAPAAERGVAVPDAGAASR
jgi:hypothetical protein